MASQFPAASCYSEHVSTNGDVLPLRFAFSGWLFPTNLLESILSAQTAFVAFIFIFINVERRGGRPFIP